MFLFQHPPHNNWPDDVSSLRSNAKLNYINARNIHITKNKLNFTSSGSRKKNSRNSKNPLTPAQTKYARVFRVNLNTLKNSRIADLRIRSFHFKVITNSLPIYNDEKLCLLCKQAKPSGWHLLLECSVLGLAEESTLSTLGYSDNEIKSIINKRKAITRNGAKKEPQSLIWTHNWALWRTYTDFTHSENAVIEDAFKFHLSFEEFRLFQLVQSKFANHPKFPTFHNHSIVYSFHCLPNCKSIRYTKQIHHKYQLLLNQI